MNRKKAEGSAPNSWMATILTPPDGSKQLWVVPIWLKSHKGNTETCLNDQRTEVRFLLREGDQEAPHDRCMFGLPTFSRSRSKSGATNYQHTASWWFQPLWKIWVKESKWKSSPNRVENSKNIWKHLPVSLYRDSCTGKKSKYHSSKLNLSNGQESHPMAKHFKHKMCFRNSLAALVALGNSKKNGR